MNSKNGPTKVGDFTQALMSNEDLPTNSAAPVKAINKGRVYVLTTLEKGQ